MTLAANGTGSPLVIGIGNPDRGDDGIGPLVVRQLAGMVPAGVTLIERSGDAQALIDDWAGHDTVILVDAAESRKAPGTVHRVDLRAQTLPPEISLSSSHAFGVAEAVGLAGALGLLPTNIIAFAIEGASFDPGAPVSPIVAAAAGEVAIRVADELRRLDPSPHGAIRSWQDILAPWPERRPASPDIPSPWPGSSAPSTSWRGPWPARARP
jgi:hydrogenase maturation protease